MKRNKIIISLVILLLLAVDAAAYSIHNTGFTGTGQYKVLLANKALKSEAIKVENNTSGYNAGIELYEDSSKADFIRLEYFYKGESRKLNLSSKAVPEIAGIFSKRAQYSSKTEAYKIRNAYLNSRLAKVYLVINGRQYSKTVQTTLYSINLSDSTVKKVFSNNGKYGSFSFNKSGKYMVYSYNDPSESSMLQENTLFEVLDCTKDKLAVKNSRTSNGKRIGPNVEPKTVFDYTFSEWNSDSTVKLLQKPSVKGKNGKSLESKVLYNIPKNLFVDRNGNALKTTSQTVTTNASTESAALKTLKTCYTYLKSEKDYNKALALLDDKFTIKMGIFKSFGVDQLVKEDLDVKSASAYRDLLKSASFDTIVREETKDVSSTIYYYQIMGTEAGSQVRFPMCAKLKRLDKEWKILSLQDVDETKPPFVK